MTLSLRRYGWVMKLSLNRLYLLGWLLAIAGMSPAQELEISVSPSPVGSGARAAGMADAFVAIADDATAASWNPAGLVQLERPEVAIVGVFNAVYESFGASYHPEFDSNHHDSNIALNFLSITYPLPRLVLGRNAVVGLYYQQKYDFSRSFSAEYNTASVNPFTGVTNTFADFDFDQEGSIGTTTAAFAIELTHRLSFGVGVNFWRDTFFHDNKWEQHFQTSTFSMAGAVPRLTLRDTWEAYENVRGENVTVGLLWSVNDKWSAGLRYDSAWTAKADYSREGSDIQLTMGGILTPLVVLPDIAEEPRRIRFPATLALGFAHRPNDRLSIAVDVSRTDWNDFWFKDSSGNRFSLINAANLDAVMFAPSFPATYTVRLGAEYVFIPKHPTESLDRLWTLRGGLFYDQEPKAEGHDDFYGAAIGAGLLLNRRINIDAAYQIRYGRDVNSDFFRGISGFDEDVFQHRFLISSVIYF